MGVFRSKMGCGGSGEEGGEVKVEVTVSAHKEEHEKKEKGHKKGVYWKISGEDAVHFSRTGRKSKRVRDEGVVFATEEDYKNHRKEHGWPEDYSDVLEVDPPGPAARDHSGLYWKIAGTDQVYFSKSKKRVRADKAFDDPEEYNKHRKHHGWPEDWSEIAELEEDFWPDTEISKYMAKGVYWKVTGTDAVHYSKHGKLEGPIRSLSDDCTFADEAEYFAHRKEHGYPENWDYFREVEEGAVASESDSSSSDSD